MYTSSSGKPERLASIHDLITVSAMINTCAWYFGRKFNTPYAPFSEGGPWKKDATSAMVLTAGTVQPGSCVGSKVLGCDIKAKYNIIQCFQRSCNVLLHNSIFLLKLISEASSDWEVALKPVIASLLLNHAAEFILRRQLATCR